MSIFIRIWFFFGLVILLGLWFMSYTFNQQVKPNVRQVVEDTLAENANVIAALVAEDVLHGRIDRPEFDQKIQHALDRKLNQVSLLQPNPQDEHSQARAQHQQIYITDAQGIVLYDSQGLATGQDYSKWNDVYLTLKGQYGVRSTRSSIDRNTATHENTSANNSSSSVMFIAAPIFDQQQLIGVVSIGKPNSSVLPYIQGAENKLYLHSIWIGLVCLFLASLVAYWIKHSIDRVRKYAQALAPVNQAPHFSSAQELNLVTQAVEHMREQLEDRAYVEHYVNTLTHELKSPLSAIQASAELLGEDLPLHDQQQFAAHIHKQSQRLKVLIDRMLLLTRLEKSKPALELQWLNLSELLTQIVQQQHSQRQHRNIDCQFEIEARCFVQADRFWLHQMLLNVFDNAMDFTPNAGKIAVKLHYVDAQQMLHLYVLNEGALIPEYALTHIFETYYSLPRPSTQQRSSGIGLSIVKHVIEQHHGQISIQNCASDGFAAAVPHQAGVLVHIQLHKNFI